MNEPTTTISTVDYTIGYAPDPPDNRLNILSPIISPQGPVELRRINGPSEFQRLYFGGRSVKSTDDRSAIFARGLVSSAPIWVKRGVRDNLKGGLSSSVGEEIFTDSELNLITGLKANFEFNTNGSFIPYNTAISNLKMPSTSTAYSASVVAGHLDQLVFDNTQTIIDGSKIFINDSNKSNYTISLTVSGGIHNYTIVSVSEDGYTFTVESSETPAVALVAGLYTDVVFVSPNQTQYTVTDKMIYSNVALPPELIKSNSNSTKLKTILKFNEGSAGASTEVVVTILNNQYSIPMGSTSLGSLLQKFWDNKIFPQLVYFNSSATDPSFVQVVDSPTGTKVVEFGTRDIKAIGWTSNIGIMLSNTTAGITVDHPESGSTVNQAPLKSSYDYQEDYPIPSPKFDVLTDEGVKYCFYAGNAVADGDINTYLSPTNPSFKEFMKGLVKNASDLLNADSGTANSLILPFASDFSYEDENTTPGSSTDTSLLLVGKSSINEIIGNDKFAIISAFPCESNAISVSITESEIEEAYRLTVTYGTDSEVWDISFDSGVTDGYGESLFYTKVNEQSSYIRIVELEGPSVTYQNLQLGNEITSKYCDVAEMQSAMESMKENDEASVDFDYITDGGYTNIPFSKYIIQLCEFYNSFYPVSVRTGVSLTKADLIDYRSGLGDTARARFIADTQRAVVLDNGSIEMPASYFYLLSRISLGNTVREFVKFMEETNGDIGMQNPIKKFSRTDREQLLDYQIVTLKKGRNGSWYLNECLTLYKVSSYLQEDGTVLMVNKVNQLARAYADPLKGQDNTSDLRSSVETELLRIINDRLRTGTKYGPINMRVVCNDSNNPVSLQNQRKLRIDIYATFSRSIKDVLIYTNVIPLT